MVWSELLAQEPPLKVEDLQAYVILRGSLLSSEDKKRVLVDAGAETDGSLTMKRVSAAVRMLGAGFFHDYTGTKKTRLKTYDEQAFVTEEIPGDDGEIFVAADEDEADFIDALVQDGDEDAVLVAEYEGAINDTIQDDQELAVTLNAYSEARRRLSERFRNRGFWPVRAKGRGKGQKGKHKSGGGKKSLQDRILSSRCRICNKVGHWKAECPDRHKSTGSGSTFSAPTASVTMTEGMSGPTEDALHLEFLNLPEFAVESPLDESRSHDSLCLLSVGEALKGISMRGSYKSYKPHIQGHGVDTVPRNDDPSSVRAVSSVNSADIMFASCGTCGVVDLGASKTVIGSNNLRELMQGLSSKVQDQLQRCPCRMHFRFGNQGVLSSSHALVVPIGGLKLKIAIVPGNTPFLLSNSFLRGFQAIIDTNQKTLSSPLLKHKISLQLSSRGLFLMDLNEVIDAAKSEASAKSA